MKRKQEYTGYKTEEQLKAEAKLRARQEAQRAGDTPPPSPGRKKLENFWYHYRWQVIIAAVAAAFAGMLIKDLLFRTSPDLTVILVCARPLSGESVAALEQALAARADDYNGDGEVAVTVDYLLFTPDGEDAGEEGQTAVPQADYATAIKLTTLVVSGVDPLFLLDDAAYRHLCDIGGGEAPFIPLELSGARGDRLPFTGTVLAGDPALADFTDHAFCVREGFDGTEQKRRYQAYCLEFLQALAA